MIVQVCPPGAGGVRDFAEALARAWMPRGIDTALVEGTPNDLRDRLESMSHAAGGGQLRIVLHFSGYGYAPRGMCGWLVDTLAQFKRTRGADARLVVVFHELFATGLPWRSAFWLSPWQAQVARRLACLADGLWTSTPQYADWLRSVVDGSTPLQVQPVFSNIGELAELPAWDARAPRAVVFGTAVTRARAFATLRAHAPALARLGLAEIVEAGTGPSQAGPASAMPTRHLGRLSAPELGALLSGSRFGLLDYPVSHLGKSGVFAAYAAHGCVAVNTSDVGGHAEELRAGAHYINLRRPFESDARALARIAQRLHRWYRQHSLALQSNKLMQVAIGEPRRLAAPA